MNREFYIENLYSAFVVQNENPKDYLETKREGVNIVVVNSGKLLVCAGESVFECTQGTAAVLPSNKLNFVKLVEGVYCEYTVLSFLAEGSFCESIKPFAAALSVFQKQLILDINSQITEFAKVGNTFSFETQNDLKTSKFISSVELASLNLLDLKGEIEPIETRDSSLFKAATEIMYKNVTGGISVEELAKELGISLSHVKRIFAFFTEVGVHEYFMLLKVLRAKQMLKEGNSVTETAEVMGFNNQNYFSQAFKRITGVTPKEYSGSKRKAEPKTEKAAKETKPKTTQKPAKEMPSYLL